MNSAAIMFYPVVGPQHKLSGTVQACELWLLIESVEVKRAWWHGSDGLHLALAVVCVALNHTYYANTLSKYYANTLSKWRN